jgi:hypothetical protein
MMIQARKLAAAALIAILFSSGNARATTLKRMSVADLSRAAHTIVRARCVATSTGWDSGEIWTFTTLEVEEVWKGSVPTRITVRLIGGEAGNLKSTVSGVPRFGRGEELVLFLERTGAGDFSIVSWVQGTFRITHERGTESDFVTQDTAGFAVFNPVSHRYQSTGIRNMRSDSFRALVAASVEAEPEKKQ